ncbi:MAG: diphthine--ammonia ligase [Candidatus Pacearchaeota archaeon]
MKLAILFSGGKDSTYAGYLAKKQGNKLVCLISVYSKNKDSFMFHTPSIEKTKKQSIVMNIPLIIKKTKGKKEEELKDLEKAIKNAIKKYRIDGIITGAVESVYQASRIQKICDKLKIKCFNPLWKKNQIGLLNEIVKNKFNAIIVGVAAYPLGKEWLGRKIDKEFITEVKWLQEKYKINPAGEGGEFETFVLNCPLFKKPLKLINKKISGSGNAWRLDIEVE